MNIRYTLLFFAAMNLAMLHASDTGGTDGSPIWLPIREKAKKCIQNGTMLFDQVTTEMKACIDEYCEQFEKLVIACHNQSTFSFDEFQNVYSCTDLLKFCTKARKTNIDDLQEALLNKFEKNLWQIAEQEIATISQAEDSLTAVAILEKHKNRWKSSWNCHLPLQISYLRRELGEIKQLVTQGEKPARRLTAEQRREKYGIRETPQPQGAPPSQSEADLVWKVPRPSERPKVLPPLFPRDRTPFTPITRERDLPASPGEKKVSQREREGETIAETHRNGPKKLEGASEPSGRPAKKMEPAIDKPQAAKSAVYIADHSLDEKKSEKETMPWLSHITIYRAAGGLALLALAITLICTQTQKKTPLLKTA